MRGLPAAPRGCGREWVRSQQQGRTLEHQAERVPAWASKVPTGQAGVHWDHPVQMARAELEAPTGRTAAHPEQTEPTGLDAELEAPTGRTAAHPEQAEPEALTGRTAAHPVQAEPTGRAGGQAVRGDQAAKGAVRSSLSERRGSAVPAQAGVRHPVRQAQAGQDVGHQVPQGLVGRKPSLLLLGGDPRLAELGSVGFQGRGFSEGRAWWPTPG